MPGGRDTVGGGVRDKDDGSGAFVTGEAAGSDLVQVVRGVYGVQVADEGHADTAWEGSGGETALVSHAPR